MPTQLVSKILILEKDRARGERYKRTLMREYGRGQPVECTVVGTRNEARTHLDAGNEPDIIVIASQQFDFAQGTRELDWRPRRPKT